ncbi:flagellar hook-associated protein FlgL [Leptothrix discophora]|uniref:Flagellar hook-associated protein FlgL n=1 Tax=Leptothrix discophora TaxID=89 RepID=A0ABT9FYC7_LEPDI|nr:flagellar hook-associated protein FlgL [Leptothrix discophora]MDP4299145.1 flagellar hook-associated protein FlgL [Leptothrix discophora]
MRISTAQTYETTVNSLQRRQQELSRSQSQMTSGKRIDRASDDPTAAARAERALIEQSRGETTLRVADASRNAMQLSESALGDATNLLQSARETLVAAGNGAYQPTERRALALQLREVRMQLLNVANQQDGNGGYLFGGQGVKTAPFLDAVGGVAFASTGGQIDGSTSERLPLSVDGEQVWLHARSGNGVFETAASTGNTGSAWVDGGQVTDPSALPAGDVALLFGTDASGATTYSVVDPASGSVLNDASGTPMSGLPFASGKSIEVMGMALKVTGQPAPGDQFTMKQATPDLSVFDALDNALSVLEDPLASRGAVSQAVSNGLRDMDQALSNFQSARSTAGETLNRIDGLTDRTNARILSAKTTRSDAEDLDMVQAVSDFTNKQTSYQAALQSYSMVQKLSLFNYIGN